MSRNSATRTMVPAADMVKTLRGAVRKHGNNYALSKDTGVPASVIQRFLHGGPDGKGSDVRLSTASKLAAALSLRLCKDEP